MEPPSALPGRNSGFALHGHRVVALSGRDATTFAQAQFMSDAKALAPGHWQWSGWLTPKGRVIALFALLKFDDEKLWLLLPDADPAEFAARLQKFVFRSKTAIAVREDLHASGAFEATPALGSALADDGSVVALDMGGAGGARTLRLSASKAVSETEPDDLARWAAFDLTHGLPHLPASQSEQWTPQQLSLDRLRAYSVKKGCYPGQEIVARTHFLGQAKRGLVLFESTQALEPGAQVEHEGKSLGTVVSVAQAEARTLALAVLPLDAPQAGLHASGAALTTLPLSDGLAR
ncbi:MAG TPA: folate-binding protein [Luteimonas sp.]|nr:folate-binding protein [Luteimonas sp.]